MPGPKPASNLRALLIIAIVAVILALGYYGYSVRLPPAERMSAAQVLPEPPPAPAEPQYPVPPPAAVDSPTLPALPALYESDADLLAALALLLEDDSLLALLVREHLIERFVASVDNLPNRRITANILPMRPLSGSLVVQDSEQGMILSAQNSERYRAPVKALTSLDPTALVHLYQRWYPLFQQAYRELGYPDGYFNDRLIEVIDHLLAAPEPDAAIALLAVNGRFQFADPAFESASIGHKALLRLGVASAAEVKAWLGGIKALLVALPGTAQAGRVEAAVIP